VIGLVLTAAKLWFYRNWMYAGLVVAAFLLILLPLLAADWSAALVATFIQLPAYLLHQVEEHAGDRFRRFINSRVAHAANALTTAAVVVINVPLVWGVDLAALYLARTVAIGWGLIAIYLTLVNAIVHIVAGVALRGYNPGLATAVLIFLPASIWGVVVMAGTPGVTLLQHAVGLALALAVHIGLAAHVLRRARSIRDAAPAAA
jgi:Protein of unknown function with HXXEE motif